MWDVLQGCGTWYRGVGRVIGAWDVGIGVWDVLQGRGTCYRGVGRGYRGVGRRYRGVGRVTGVWDVV